MNRSVLITSLGTFEVIDDSNAILRIQTSSDEPTEMSVLAKDFQKQLEEYITLRRNSFSLPFQLSGTSFQMDIWKTLMKVPYGKTVSYQELANMAGHAKAYRATGTACKMNPLPFILPCHRIIRSDHQLGEYALGKEKKAQLIELERHGL